MRRRVVAIRPWAEEDSETALEWWHDCWTSAGLSDPAPEPAPRIEAGACTGRVFAVTLDGVASGLSVVEDDALVKMIALRKGLRGWGYGSEAVRLVEETMPGDVARALASPAVGLSLYFWLRLGYAPSQRQPYVKAVMLEKPLRKGTSHGRR